MTNGEKIKQAFPDLQIDIGELEVYMWTTAHDAIDIPLEWWNAEYKEPNKSEIPTGSINKNCRTCRNFGSHHGICEICKDNKCWTEKEPITKNDKEQKDITWIVGNNNVQIAVRNMPVDMMQKICAIIGNKQEPFINKPCVSGGVCEYDKQKALDKLRAEVGQTRKMYLDMNDIDWLNGCDYVLSVIDKYKAETEEENVSL